MVRMKESVDFQSNSAEAKTKKMHPNSLRNLEPGKGRIKGSKNKRTLLTEALMQAHIKDIPWEVQKNYGKILAWQKLLKILHTAQKEEIQLQAIDRVLDRTIPKVPVLVEMDSRSQQITGSLVDLLALLRQTETLRQPSGPEKGDTIAASSTEGEKPEGMNTP
jgi:hypothetical protein